MKIEEEIIDAEFSWLVAERMYEFHNPLLTQGI
jgi:hypothetical protein